MAILEMDTDALRAAVGTAKAASDAISSAMELLNRITVHNDWECKERDAINQYTLDNRAKIGQMNEAANAFYGAVEFAAARFEEEEQKQISAQQGVDEVLAQISNVVPGGSLGGSIAGGMTDAGNIAISVFQSLGKS